MSVIAWLGGVAFVSSLAYLMYFFAVQLAVPAPPGTSVWPPTLVDAMLFAMFAAHHSLMARTGVKQRLTRIVPAKAERTLYVWVASALLAAVCAFWRPLPGLVYQVDGLWRAPLFTLQAVGVVLVVRAARAISPLELAGIRQASSLPSRDALSDAGPFGLVRHPIYLGWMLLVFGTPAMTASRLLFAVLSTGYLILAIPWEERSLAAVHGDRYRAYQRTVRWRVIPGIW